MLNSDDVCLVAFQTFTKCQFPQPLHSNLKITSWIFPPLRADNPTHPQLKPSFFPWFAQGPTPGASWRHVQMSNTSLTTFSCPCGAPILITQCTTFLAHYIYMYDWLILLLKMRKSGTHTRYFLVPHFRTRISQSQLSGKWDYCNDRISNLIGEPLKMAIVRTWFFVWEKSPAYLFNHEERENPT